MVYSKARFVIYYKDGETYIEDRNNKRSWDDRPLKPIKAIGIQPDPEISVNIKMDNGKLERRVIKLDSRIVLDVIVMKGSFKYDYGFFMFKTADHKIMNVATGKIIDKKHVIGITIGMVVDNLGHCICKEYVGSSPRSYYTTVKSLGMDANSLSVNYNINLEDLPDPKSEMPMYPEINPIIVEKKKQKLLKQKERAKIENRT